MELANSFLTENTYEQSCCCIHTMWLYFWSSHLSYQRIYELDDSGEETRQLLWFTNINFIHNYKQYNIKNFRAFGQLLVLWPEVQWTYDITLHALYAVSSQISETVADCFSNFA